MAERLIQCVIETSEPEHARQARAAAVATALSEDLRLVDPPTVKAQHHAGRRYYVYVWETRPLDARPPTRFDRDARR